MAMQASGNDVIQTGAFVSRGASQHGGRLSPIALVLALGFGCQLGCGAASPEPEPAEDPVLVEAEPEVTAPPGPSPSVEESEPELATPEADPAPPEPRDVRYRVTPQGLVIETEGVRFEPKATPVRVGAGWGVKIEVKASSVAGTRSLLSPKRGALAFAGSVKRGSEQPFGDEREGDGEVVVSPDKEQVLSRTWPNQGDKPLVRGEELTLHVGLWGLGDSPTTTRPLKKFFLLRMVAGTKTPQPVIQPPDVE